MSIETKSKIDVEEDEDTDNSTGSDSGDWCVVLFNDEVHTFQEVIQWLMQFADHQKQKAKNIAVVVDMQGEGVCYSGSKEECEEVKEKLADKGLDVEVQQNTNN